MTAAHDALAGPRCGRAQVGAAVELLHTAFVIHDDVIDGDDVRRGRLNVSGTFHAHALASGARRAMPRTTAARPASWPGTSPWPPRSARSPPAGPRQRSCTGCSTSSTPPCTPRRRESSPTSRCPWTGRCLPVESLAMEEQKTGAYSFALPLQAGALLAGAGEETVAPPRGGRPDAGGRLPAGPTTSSACSATRRAPARAPPATCGRASRRRSSRRRGHPRVAADPPVRRTGTSPTRSSTRYGACSRPPGRAGCRGARRAVPRHRSRGGRGAGRPRQELLATVTTRFTSVPADSDEVAA